MSNEVRIKIKTDQKGAARDVKKLNNRFSALKTSLGSVAKKMAIAGAATGAAAGAIGFLTTKTFSAASDLELLNSKIDNVFGDSVGTINDWADNLSVRLGMTSTQLAGAASSFGDVLVPMGFTQEAAANMSTEVIGLSGALSEWSGGTKSVADVSEILTKAMTGEVEGLKSLGVVLSAARIETEMLALSEAGMAGATEQQTKALAIQSLVMKDTEAARTAFANNNDGLVVASNALKSALGTVKEELLIGLTPTFKELAGVLKDDVVPFIVDTFIPALQENLPGAIETTKDVFKTLGSVLELLMPVIGLVVEHAQRMIKVIGFVADTVNKVIGVFKRQREENSKVVDVYSQTEEQLEKTFAAYEKFGGSISDVTKQSLKNAAQLNTEEEKLKEITKFKGMAITKTEEFAVATENTTAALGKSTDALTAHGLATKLVSEGFFELDQAAQQSTMKLVAASFRRTASIENEAERTAALIDSLAKSIRGEAGFGSEIDFIGNFSNVTGLTAKEEMDELINKQLDEIGDVIDGYQAVAKGNTEKGRFGFNITAGVGAIKQIGILGGGIGGTADDPLAAFRRVQEMSAKADHAFDLDSVVAKQVADTLGAQAIQQMKSGEVNLNFEISVSEMTDPQAVGDKILEILKQNDLAKATASTEIFGADTP